MSFSKSLSTNVGIPTQNPNVEQPGPEARHNLFKRLLRFSGARSSSRFVQSLRKTVSVLEVSNWLASECSYDRAIELQKGERVFEAIASQIQDKRVLYLEFGVWRGYSMRCWSKLLRHPQSILHGFDAFEGLPEAWTDFYRKGSLSESGRIPTIEDKRVQFFKGWFEDTLKTYIPPRQHDVLLVNIDCDLYSSATVVLDFLWKQNLLDIGSWIYFSEFADRDHEFRAFREFVQSTELRFRLIAQANHMWNAAFKRID
jgi:hypothetical protein